MKKITLAALVSITSLSAGAQLQNTDFEVWDTTPNRPAGWIWSNSSVISGTADFYYPPSTDAQRNSYALKLSIWYNYTKDVAIQTAPISSRPAALSGYYKYTDNLVDGDTGPVVDTAQVSLYLTRWNAVAARRDTIGTGMLNLNQSLTYRAFNCTVNYTSPLLPDSVTVLLDCSIIRKGTNNFTVSGNGIGSVFTIDNISLGNGNLSAGNLPVANEIMVYPNPATDQVYIPGFDGQVTVTDMKGSVVAQQYLVGNKPLAVGQLSAGVYFLRLQDAKGMHYGKITRK